MTSDTLSFAAAAAVMVAAAIAFVVVPLWRSARPRGPRSTACNVAVYRSSLADLERERGAGLVDDAERKEMADELARRLLADARDDPPPGRARARVAALVMALALPIAATGLYELFGNPASLASASPDDASSPHAVRARIVSHLARQPDDGRAWVTLARLDVEHERFADAARSYERALAASARIARDAGVWCELADALGMANGGRLAGRPSELIEQALRIDASHARALEMAGSAAYERGDFRAAAFYWRQLAMRLDATSAARVELESAIERAERFAATRLPGAMPAKPAGRS
jgi:cytochrome c-type biogenesis protein CcmH